MRLHLAGSQSNLDQNLSPSTETSASIKLGCLVYSQRTASNCFEEKKKGSNTMNNTAFQNFIVQGYDVNWINSAWVLTTTLFIALLLYSTRKEPFPNSAPSLLSENLPVVGAFRFFTSRATFLKDGAANSKTGNFSFYVGKHQVVGLSGLEGRRVFYESKELSSHQG